LKFKNLSFSKFLLHERGSYFAKQEVYLFLAFGFITYIETDKQTDILLRFLNPYLKKKLIDEKGSYFAQREVLPVSSAHIA
jgi:hypothetical protein